MGKSTSIGAKNKQPKRLSKSAQSVVDLVEINPEATAEDLSKELGVSTSAIKKRLQRLLRSGAIAVRLSVASDCSRLSAKAIVSMKIAHNLLSRRTKPVYRGMREFTRFLGSQLSHTPEATEFLAARDYGTVVVRGAYSVAGAGLGTDVIVVVEGTHENLIRDFVTEVLARLDGVLETNTAAVAYGTT